MVPSRRATLTNMDYLIALRAARRSLASLLIATTPRLRRRSRVAPSPLISDWHD